MFYIKHKSYAGRWLVRILQATLILGIAIYGLDFIGQMTESQPEAVIIESNIEQPQVQVITIQPQVEDDVQYDEVDYFYFGLEHQRSGEYYDAIADYTRSVELNPEIASSFLNRGVAYEQLGNNEYRAMVDFAAWMTRDDMTVLSRGVATESVDITATMSANYRFEVPMELNAGDIVSLSAVSVNEDEVDPIIVLVDENGYPVAANDDVRRDDGSLVSMNSHINQYEVTRKGVYTLLVSHAGGGSYGDFIIRVNIDN